MAQDIEALGRKSLAVTADLSRFQEAENIGAAALEAFGKVDILVNNAGITRDNLFLKMKEEEWDAVMTANLRSVFNCSKAVIRPMMKQRYGKIVNIASVVGQTGNAGQANYAASKAAIIGLTKVLHKSFRLVASTNAVAPGFIETEMTRSLPEKVQAEFLHRIPLGRMGTPDDVAEAVLFLASGRIAVYYRTGDQREWRTIHVNRMLQTINDGGVQWPRTVLKKN